MGKIYVGQSALTIRLDTQTNLTGVTEPKINYTKPGGTSGSWVASVTGINSTILSYNVADVNQLDEAGTWILWASAIFDIGTTYGEPVNLTVYTPGT